jgi:hypothetical protein
MIDEFDPSFGSHPSMMVSFVMCSFKKSINNNFFIYFIVVFGAIVNTTFCFNAILMLDETNHKR